MLMTVIRGNWPLGEHLEPGLGFIMLLFVNCDMDPYGSMYGSVRVRFKLPSITINALWPIYLSMHPLLCMSTYDTYMYQKNVLEMKKQGCSVSLNCGAKELFVLCVRLSILSPSILPSRPP